MRINGHGCEISGVDEVVAPLDASFAASAGSTAMDRVQNDFSCRSTVDAGSVNHLEVVVADQGDAARDTAVLIGAGALEVEAEPTFTATVDPTARLDRATGVVTVSGTFTGCNRTFDIVADPDVGLEQGVLPDRIDDYSHIDTTRCRPGDVVTWSVAFPEGAVPPARPFVAGPALVDAYFVTYEVDGQEGYGHSSVTNVPVTLVATP